MSIQLMAKKYCLKKHFNRYILNYLIVKHKKHRHVDDNDKGGKKKKLKKEEIQKKEKHDLIVK